jgi:fructose-1-phosphate kinase PfkB-like protein
VLEITPPAVDALCPIGAGDAMSAAIVWSLGRGDSLGDALRWGVAAGTASALLPGIELANLEQTKKIYGQTTITRVVV